MQTDEYIHRTCIQMMSAAWHQYPVLIITDHKEDLDQTEYEMRTTRDLQASPSPALGKKYRTLLQDGSERHEK